MIPIIDAYKAGLRSAWNHRPLLFTLYLINFVFAYFALIPFSMMLSKGLANTTAAAELLRVWDYTLFLSLIREYGKGLSLGRILVTFSLFYLFINTFLAGGIMQTFINEKGFDWREFWSGCANFFWRYLKLMLFSLLFVSGVVIFMIFIDGIFDWLAEGASTERLQVIFTFIEIGIFIFLLLMINMLFDYAKIIMAVNDYYGAWSTIKTAMMFVAMSLRKTTGLYFLFFITGLLLLAVYWILESGLQVSSAFTVLVFFVLTQIYMLAKTWLRLSFFGGQYVYYRYSNTAMPGLTQEMLDQAVADYESRVSESRKSG